MDSIRHLWLRARSRLHQGLFAFKEWLLSKRRASRPLRILFSRQDGWAAMIQAGFADTPHQVFFGDFNQFDLGQFDLIVPLSVGAVLALGALGRKAAHNLLPMPSAQAVLLCHDKLRLNQRLIEAGFGAHIPAMLSQPQAPFILKKRVAENSEHCHLVLDEGSRRRLEPLIASEDYFCQAIVSGTSEFATHLLFDGNEIVTEITVEYLADRPAFIKGSEPFFAKDLTHCRDPELLRNMLRAVGFRGLCCLNYKVADGRVQLLEINPRFGGSLSPLFYAMVRHLSGARRRRLAAGAGPWSMQH